MLLLDHNVPVGVLHFLKRQGFECETTAARGWDALTNGELTQVAVGAGFNCILTRDRRFIKAASSALNKNSTMCIVFITIPQAKGRTFIENFHNAWNSKRFTVQPGKFIPWPI